MNIKLLNYYLFSVSVSFEISRIHIPYSRHIIMELLIDGKKGTGEGISYKSSLSKIEKYISKIDFNRIDMNDLVSKEPGLAAAIDQAINFSKEAGTGFSRPRTKYTKQVFIQPVNQMINEVDKLVNGGCTDIKLKLGRRVKDDIQLIKILASKFPKINFKADVNGGYNIEEFEKILKMNKGFIQVWEEPIQKKDQRFLANLKRKYKIKIMLDESVRKIEDLNYYIKENLIDILNIKLSRVGGLSYAKEYVKICQQNNIEISIGCSEELGIGMLAINVLASRIKNLVGVEGIGSERLGFDVIDKNNHFSERKLYDAAKNKKFKVFSKKNKMQLTDIFCEVKENYKAKLNNLRILL